MIRSLLTLGLVFTLHLLTAQEKVAPLIKDGASVYVVENAVERADPGMDYKIVVDIKSGNKTQKSVNWQLSSLARTLNLHAAAGVKKEHLQVVVAIHNAATTSVLTNEAFQKKFKMDNPNIDIIRQLTEANVKIFVCGQSIFSRGYKEEDILPEVGLAVSAQVVLTTYQLKGHVLMKY